MPAILEVALTKLKSTLTVETAFGSYALDELIGEGGAGRVYAGHSLDGLPVAVKVLSSERVSRDKKVRFRKEIAFLSRNTHQHIVTVTDYGVATDPKLSGSFYVMKRYDTNLRSLMTAGIPASDIIRLFVLEILDGVEAAHLRGATHRDLKPENILSDAKGASPAIADFGIASFTEDLLVTLIETGPTQRLANFQYAAPEQRLAGRQVTQTADIYALGLILNEMFTGTVPHGTEFRTIAQAAEHFSYLDQIVAQMLRQTPSERPASIAAVKDLLQRHQAEAISLQRLSQITREVVKVGEIDDPLASDPPRIVGVNWNNGTLFIELDRPVHEGWVSALQNMGSHSSVWNRGPETFQFNGTKARVAANEHEAQQIIDHFKVWLPQATRVLRHNLEQNAIKAAQQRTAELARAKAEEERLIRVNSSLKF
jgi:serine/threonine protein kinase